MRKAWTMIELIFIIVIIGILAAIAIPKLTVTKVDAQASKIVYSLATCINDAGAAFSQTSYFSGDSSKKDSLPINSTACKEGIAPNENQDPCFLITVNDSSGEINVANNLTNSSSICKEAQRLATKNGIGSDDGKTHKYNF